MMVMNLHPAGMYTIPAVDCLEATMHLPERSKMEAVPGREVRCYGISAKEETNLDAVLEWSINRPARKKRRILTPYWNG